MAEDKNPRLLVTAVIRVDKARFEELVRDGDITESMDTWEADEWDEAFGLGAIDFDNVIAAFDYPPELGLHEVVVAAHIRVTP